MFLQLFWNLFVLFGTYGELFRDCSGTFRELFGAIPTLCVGTFLELINTKELLFFVVALSFRDTNRLKVFKRAT